MNSFVIFLVSSLFAIASVNASEGWRVTKDIPFKTVDEQVLKLDLYLPKVKSESPYPLLIWVHGGAWKRGSKDAIPTKNPLLLHSLLKQGYALASVDYRLSGKATYPAPVVDINDALNFLHDNAAKYHIAADQLVMMGRSAGGHLAGLIGATNAYGDIAFYAAPKYQVAAVVSFFGPTDLVALGNKGNKKITKKSSLSRFLGDIPSSIPKLARQASTSTYINKNTPPFIQLHGTLDKRVPLSQSVLLKEALDHYGVDNELYIEEGVGHSAPVFDTEKYVPHVLAFLSRHFPKP